MDCHSEESNEKNRLSHVGKPGSHKSRLESSGEKNYNWKGEFAGYSALHKWVQRNLKKPEECPKCHRSVRLELSNKDHCYRRILEDYEYLCCRCHRKYEREVMGVVYGKKVK